MTREEMLNHLETMSCYPEYPGDREALDMAIQALDQESILDKIRAEIMDTGAYEQETNGQTEFLEGINYCLNVIDKYKTESEKKE